MSAQNPTPAAVEWLRALARHLELNPHLTESAPHIRFADRQIQIYPHGFDGDNKHLAALAAWANSLVGADPVKVTCNNARNGLHLLMSGRFADGAEVGIVCLPQGDQAAALEADSTNLAEGASFPVGRVFEVLGTERTVVAVVSTDGEFEALITARETAVRNALAAVEPSRIGCITHSGIDGVLVMLRGPGSHAAVTDALRDARITYNDDADTFVVAFPDRAVPLDEALAPYVARMDARRAQRKAGKSAVPAAERTCESPGDQEHDHAMCEDVVAARAALRPVQSFFPTGLAAEAVDGIVVSPTLREIAEGDERSIVCEDCGEALCGLHRVNDAALLAEFRDGHRCEHATDGLLMELYAANAAALARTRAVRREQPTVVLTGTWAQAGTRVTA